MSDLIFGYKIEMALRFRPHHLLCTLGFVGKGYSPQFVHNFRKLTEKLNERGGESLQIKITAQSDHICEPCPHRRDSSCASAEKINQLDKAHANILGISEGSTLSWQEAQNLLASKMTDELFEKACAPCSWKALGVCHTALKKLRSERVCANKTPLLLLIALFLFNHSEAATPSPPPAIPAHQVQEYLSKSRHSKSAQQLSAALKALAEKKTETAKKLATPLQNNPDYSDYSFAILASSLRLEAEKNWVEKKWDTSTAVGKKAISTYLQIEALAPASPLLRRLPETLAEIEFHLGQVYYAQKNWKQASLYYERGFLRLLESSQPSAHHTILASALNRYSEICAKTNTSLCDIWSRKLVSLYPKNSKEQQAIAQHLPTALESSKPLPVKKLTQAYKATDLDFTAFDSALLLYWNGKYSKATQAFRQFMDEFPKSAYRYRARYWLAQALKAQGETPAYRAVLENLTLDSPLTYYGLLASLECAPLECKTSVENRLSATLPLVHVTDSKLSPAELFYLRRAEELLAAGLPEQAALELVNFKPRDALSSPFLLYLAELSHQSGNHRSAFIFLSELILRGHADIFSSYGLQLIFPLKHWGLIEKYSSQHKLNPLLVLSLMKQESAFDTSALSVSGASGLMQLMPATALDVDANVNRPDLSEAEANIRIGTRYLSQLLQRFQGNTAMALAAYNAGPNAVDRWIREGRHQKGLIAFIDQIPYRETREYVAAIVRNYYWYSSKLQGEAPKNLLELFWSTATRE